MSYNYLRECLLINMHCELTIAVKILNKGQYGFHKKKITWSNLHEIVHDIKNKAKKTTPSPKKI